MRSRESVNELRPGGSGLLVCFAPGIAGTLQATETRLRPERWTMRNTESLFAEWAAIDDVRGRLSAFR